MYVTESKVSRWSRQSLIYGLLIAGGLVVLFPLVWTFSTSLKTPDQVTMRSVQLIPDQVAWSNYQEIFDIAPVFLYFKNTMIIVIASVFGGLVTCSLAGYAFARINFPGRNVLFLILIGTMMLPYVVQIIPLFVLFDRLGWVGTFLPLVVPRLLGHNAFYIFLYRQFFRGLPSEIFDAARIDGTSEIGLWWRMALPNSKPVLATMAIFSFQFAWNDFLNPLIYLGSDQSKWTMALGLNGLQGFEGEASSLPMMMVMSVFMLLPMLAIFAIGQRYMVQGVTVSGLKG
ncbi:carbohydrate ABC transporter permease [Phototrophicus methaneseepsis]|uniref:Carbohydrate ABC transporter permease n=1 Tax=Phototrophicus methaneseepsis TaxID=2710758 RepID=A0A7S8EAD8_9CHLR|nr:carbohydrate ABC transporter permease [Phototrophicus methaneseepsis]QPC83347.1 carbohydrate ABC transporter permease [Phototrophicus methaneseepsis]